MKMSHHPRGICYHRNDQPILDHLEDGLLADAIHEAHTLGILLSLRHQAIPYCWNDYTRPVAQQEGITAYLATIGSAFLWEESCQFFYDKLR